MKFEFSMEETNMVLSALGRMPYEAVFQLVANIQKQATEQLEQQKPSGQKGNR